jgi:hypothetical protein
MKRKEEKMKRWLVLIATLALCLSTVSCGDGDNKSRWSYLCTGGRTTFVCADFSGDAEAQALADVCKEEPDCGCDCVDLHVEEGC